MSGLYFSDCVSGKEKRRLLNELLVPQSVALARPEAPGSRSLRALMQDASLTAQQKTTILSHLQECAERSINKELLSNDVVHFIFQAFCQEADEAALTDLAGKCCEGAVYLLSSKAGAEALLRMLGVISAKQRKELLRELKGKFSALAMNGVDYLVMMRLLLTVDDTVLLSKTVVAEWIKNLGQIAFDKYGHKVIAWSFQPDDKNIFSPYERECMALPSPTSVKQGDTRRRELVRLLRPPLRNIFLSEPLKAASDLHAKDLLVAYLASEWDSELVRALVDAGAEEAEATHCAQMGLLGSGTTTTTILVLLKLEPASEANASAGGFVALLWKRCFEPRLIAAATSRCAFILLELLKREAASGQSVIAASIRKRRVDLQSAVAAVESSGAVVNGAKKLLLEIDR